MHSLLKKYRHMPSFQVILAKVRKNGVLWASHRALHHLGVVANSIAQEFSPFRDGFEIDLHHLKDEKLVEVIRTLNGSKRVKVQSIHFEVTRYCNLRCPGCLLTVESNAGNWHAVHMDIEKFRAILENLPMSRVFHIQNFGEPTLHPDFIEIIRLARKSGKFDRISTTSNIMSHNPEYYTDLFDAGLDHLAISIDSLDQEIADKLRTRSKISKIMKNLAYLIKNHSRQIHIATVVNSVNFDDLENTFQYLDSSAKKDVNTLKVSPMMFSDGFVPELSHIKLDYEKINARLREFQRKFPNLFIPEVPIPKTPTKMCFRPWVNPVVNVYGELHACVSYQNTMVPSEESGSLVDRPYEDILSSSSMMDFFNSYVEATPDFCVPCKHNLPRAGEGQE